MSVKQENNQELEPNDPGSMSGSFELGFNPQNLGELSLKVICAAGFSATIQLNNLEAANTEHTQWHHNNGIPACDGIMAKPIV